MSVHQPPNLLPRIIAAAEANDVGDSVLVAELLADLERDLTPRRLAYSCHCGLAFEWPGELHRHEDIIGHGAFEEAA